MLRVITLNLNYYVDKHGSWDERKKLVVEVLMKSQPHIVALQAVAAHPNLYGGLDQALQISKELVGFSSHYFEPAQTRRDGHIQGNAVISTLPILQKSHLKLTRQPGLDDDSDRIVQRVVFDHPSGRLGLYNAHFSWVEKQALQNVAEAIQFISAGDEDVSLVAGDFNTPPGKEPLSLFTTRGFKDAWKMRYGEDSGYTFESDNPSSRIDYFWLSDTLAEDLDGVYLLSAPPDAGVRLSDHLGVMLQLKDQRA